MTYTVLDDLSHRSKVFRAKLIDEFQLADSQNDGTGELPAFSTKDMEAEPERFKRILRDMPSQLIKFKIFKRSQFRGSGKQKDKRLTRIRNLNSVPLGVWANWLVSNEWYILLINVIILLNTVLLVLQSEMPNDRYPLANRVFSVIDIMILFAFMMEIGLKWLDSFEKFWGDRWNIFDFLITTASAVPLIVLFLASNNQNRTKSLSKVAKNLRILRTLRTLKAIVRFGSLQIIVNTILDAFQSMTFIMLALILVTYIVAIFGIQLFESYTFSTISDLQFQDSFGNIGEAFLTLFQLLTLDQWYAMQDDISRVINPAVVAIYFLFWVWLGAFIFRNIFIGVMVKNFQNLSERLAREGEEAKKKKKLERLGQQLHKNLTLQTSVLKGNQNNQGPNGEGFVPGTNWADTRALSPEPGPFKGLPPAFGAPGIVSHRGGMRRGSGFGSSLGADLVNQGNHTHMNLLKQQAQLRAASNSSPAESSINLGNLNERVLRTANDAGIWDQTVANTLQALAASKEETMWPRDTLFKYLQVMESLQENLAEYYELQMLAATALNQINDN